jgi:hypothetical protein
MSEGAMFPRTLGECIDLAYTKREERLQLQRQAKELEKFEDALNEHVLQMFTETDLNGAKGQICTAAIMKSEKPVIDSDDPEAWDKYLLYVKEHNAFELLHKRITQTAVMDRLSNGEQIPGIKVITETKLSLTKASRK